LPRSIPDADRSVIYEFAMDSLQKLETAGLSAAQIAERLGTTRDAVLGRSARLRGLTVSFPNYVQREKELRAQAAVRRRERNLRRAALLFKMRDGIRKGVARQIAIARAVEGGVTYAAVGKELGLSRQRVHQIVSGP
jgi:hypothetical protein